MAKKRATRRARGRPPVHDNYAPFDAWLASGIGKEKWAALNADRYRTTPEALLKQLHRKRKELDDLA